MNIFKVLTFDYLFVRIQNVPANLLQIRSVIIILRLFRKLVVIQEKSN